NSLRSTAPWSGYIFPGCFAITLPIIIRLRWFGLAAQGFDIRKRRLSILGLGGQPDSKADIVDDHQDLLGKLKAEF
ncbi:MAG TPA: hypothetical protein VHV54_01225, partial [Candidatus Binatia bacterium]|nr:hypothetical protein [Candidatus Binatia bacterium]